MNYNKVKKSRLVVKKQELSKVQDQIQLIEHSLKNRISTRPAPSSYVLSSFFTLEHCVMFYHNLEVV